MTARLPPTPRRNTAARDLGAGMHHEFANRKQPINVTGILERCSTTLSLPAGADGNATTMTVA
eukprot:10065349-Alexandrium_andersonii.AAC.1